MDTEIFLTALAATIIGTGISWAFPPFQWIKKLLRLDKQVFLALQEQKDIRDNPSDYHYENETLPKSLTRWQNVRRLFAKALNCPSCMAFWSCAALASTNP